MPLKCLLEKPLKFFMLSWEVLWCYVEFSWQSSLIVAEDTWALIVSVIEIIAVWLM